jgi:hypothetical protein
MHGFPAWSAHRTSGLAGPEGACFKYVKLSHMPAPAPRNLRPAAYTAGAYCTIGVCSGSSSATRVTWEPTHQLPGADLGPREPAERSPRGSRQVVRGGVGGCRSAPGLVPSRLTRLRDGWPRFDALEVLPPHARERCVPAIAPHTYSGAYGDPCWIDLRSQVDREFSDLWQCSSFTVCFRSSIFR